MFHVTRSFVYLIYQSPRVNSTLSSNMRAWWAQKLRGINVRWFGESNRKWTISAIISPSLLEAIWGVWTWKQQKWKQYHHDDVTWSDLHFQGLLWKLIREWIEMKEKFPLNLNFFEIFSPLVPAVANPLIKAGKRYLKVLEKLLEIV